ncbi:MAG TPA: TonB-dependent receptor, partial [Steroidobacteraceae bacterium]|nr:TonB-dependent receptor [Steroidobacteraceae bacterium]
MKIASDVSRFAVSMTALLATPVIAQTTAAPDRGDDDLLQEVVVIGSRAEGRTVTETSVPVDVFDSSVLDTQAPADMNNVLRNLVPSFNVAQFPLSDGSSFIRPPNLRGLPPDEILVLINGKRRHRAALVQIFGGSLASGSQGPDLAQIPTIAVDRIEVLRDGAAAQYGSDAIAGVINYSLKRGSDGARFTSRYGQYSRGDGENLQIAGNLGLPLGANGFVNTSFEHYSQDITAPGGQRAGAYLLSQQRPDLNIATPANSIGDPDIRANRGFINAGMNIGDNSEIYAFGNYGESRSQIAFNWRQPVTLFGPDKNGNGNTTRYGRAAQFNDIYLDQLPDGTYNVNGATFNFASVFPAGFAPLFKGHIKDMSLVGGFKGKTGFDLNYDFSASYGQNSIDYTVGNTVNPSMGPTSPTEFDAGGLEQTETNFNVDLSYRVDAGLAGPLTIAFGGEHRREAYAIESGEPDSYAIGPYYFQRLSNGTTTAQSVGSNGFPGFSPASSVDNDRTSYAVYVDLEADVIEKLTASAAIRFEDFSDFGTTTNVKGTLRYEVNDALAFRGAASTGFRAPTPGQLFTNNTSTGFVGSEAVETASVPPTDPAAQYFGGQSLDPEESVNYSVGFVLTPTSIPITLTVDAYQIEVTDRIGFSQYFEVEVPGNPAATLANRNALRDLGVYNWATLGRVQYFTNGFDTTTRGVDVVLNHNISSDFGRFQTTLAGNYNANKVDRAEPGILSRERIGNIENLNPKVRVNLTEVWTLSDFTVLGRAGFADKWTDFAEPTDGGDKEFGSEVTFDLELAYQLNDSIRMALGGENIFNNYPDKNMRAMGLSGPAPTPTQNWYAFSDATIG